MGIIERTYQKSLDGLKNLPPLLQIREALIIHLRKLRLMEQLYSQNTRLIELAEAQIGLNTTTHNILIDKYLDECLYSNPKYAEPKRLNRFEFQAYSQNGEDGILAEIFNRIGVTNKLFVEFGVGDGLENNTAYLLIKGWNGVWIEANQKSIDSIKAKFGALIETSRLTLLNSFITAENIEPLLTSAAVPREFDLLSIDIDGNDYWVWKAIERFQPRVVMIEYNALFTPDVKWIMQYNPGAKWPRTTYFGASLKSLELLGREKGYELVCCNFTGVNAFFVQRDLIRDLFSGPFTAENHYEPMRLHLVRQSGHPRDFGPSSGS